MYQIEYTKSFWRDMNRSKRLGLNIQEVISVVEILAEDGCVPSGYTPHMLHGKYAGCWECHIDDDWLLIWRQDDKRLTLLVMRTGSHDELFHNK